MHYLTIIYTTLVIGMVYIERISHLDLLFQMALRYEHHRENFKKVSQIMLHRLDFALRKYQLLPLLMKTFT